MFVRTLLEFFITAIDVSFTIYTYIVIASCFLSFVNPDPYNRAVMFIRRFTEPAFIFIRTHLPFVVISGFDLSPVVLIFGLQFIKKLLITGLISLAF